MKRLALTLSLLLVPVALISSLRGQDAPDSDKAVKNALHAAQAMERARGYLVSSQPGKAVEALETHLSKIGGNSGYLALLREAYRGHIIQLWTANETELAKRYLDRLCVLEPGAASDPTLRPATAEEKRAIEKPAAGTPEATTKAPVPKYTSVLKEVDRGPKPSTVRAHADEPGPSVDPFSPAFRRPDPEADSKSKLAQMLVGRAEEQFAKRKFAEARQFYEQAFEADRDALTSNKGRYAYCVLDHVVTELNRPGLRPEQLTVLHKQATDAVALAPELGDKLKWVITEIDKRSKGCTAAAAPEVSGEFTLQHLGKNKEGWSVSETPHFRIFHHQGPEVAEKVAKIAETTRLQMYRKWFGHDGVDWTPKCELILHPTGTDYHKMTGVSPKSPGHTRIESDPSGKRVVSRRMDLRLDHPGFMEAVLPHETTHVVLAGMFDGHNVPRWADEGIAVLTEPSDRVQQHLRNLAQAASLRQTFGLKELMELPEYPQERRVSAFYAQSVAVVDFLTRIKGPQAVTQFLREGLKDGYESALRRHYDMDFATLEVRWQEYLAAGSLASK